MGLREKVTITLVIIALTQIACRHCMPRTPRKASLKRYLNDLKPVKNNPVSTPCSPSKVNKTPKQAFGKTAQNGRISQNSLQKKALYNTYNFPENEYPLDNAPRDPFHIGMKFNENNHANTLQKARNLQSSTINDLKKEMKIKRKLLSNKQATYENIPLKTDMSSIKIASNPDSVRLLDPETFPEVQYPLNTMDTWGQNYWNYLPFTQEKQLNGLRQQAFNPKAREGINQPFTRLTKAKASKYLQSYDKLKEEHRRTSTENSKRSNVGQKGLNFTKTATCETVSDDFITAGLLSNTLGNPSNTKTLDSSTINNENSAENTCPLIENPYHTMPLPYKVIEENMENVCPVFKLKNNTHEFEDVESSVIAKTLQLIEEILLNDDTDSKVPLKNKSKETDNFVNTIETEYTGGSANKKIPIHLIDTTETSTIVPIEELSQDLSNDAQAYILPNNLPSLPQKTIQENTAKVAGPFNVRMSLPFTEPITNGALTNTSSPNLTNTTTLSNVNTVPEYTSVIIIPMNNNAVGKSQSHMFETTSDTPIIVYLPSTLSSGIPTQTPNLNHIVSSSLGNPVPNNQLYNVLSNKAPVPNDHPSSTALVSELPNSISDSGSSSLPMHETLPTNLKCYNNENSPSSMREKPVSDILIHKSLIDVAPFVTRTCDLNLSQRPIETNNFDMDPDTLPPSLDFEHPVFEFADSDIASLSHRPYNNVPNNELPIISREIDSDHQIKNTSSKDVFIQTHDIPRHKTASMDSVLDDTLSESPNGVPTVALDKDFSSGTPTDSLLKKLHLSDSLSNFPVSTDKSISPPTLNKQIYETAQPINEMPATPLIETPFVELLLPTEAPLLPILLSETFSDKLPEIMDPIIPPSIASDITSDCAPQPIDNTSVPSPILNSTPMTTDWSIKTELYKIRQILDKMLSSKTPTVNQPPSMDTTFSPISEADSLPLLEEQSLSPIQTPTDSQPPPIDKVLSPISDTDILPVLEDRSLSHIQAPTDSQPSPLDKVLSPISDTDSLPLLEEQSLSPIQTPTDIQPPPLDQVLPPIQTPTDSQPPPLDKVLSLISDTDSLPLLEDESVPPIQAPTDNQPSPLDKVLSPISDTDSLPLLEEQSLSPIQTPTDSQPAPLDQLSSPIQIPTDSQLPQLDKELSPIQTPTDSQPPLLDNVFTPISDTDSLPLLEDHSLSPIQTPTDSQPPPLVQVSSPIQIPTDSQPPPLDKVLSPIQTPTDSQPPPLDNVLSPISDTDSLPLLEDHSLSPIQTPTDNQPSPLDKVLSPISDTDSLPLLENQAFSPTQMYTDSVPLLAEDKPLLPPPVTDSPIDSLKLQDHETLLKTPMDDGSKNTLPSVLESTESPPQPLDETVLAIPLSETTIDSKSYLIDNLVPPLNEPVTSRTKDIANNGLTLKMVDLPLKMDSKFLDIYELYGDDLTLSVDDLPIKDVVETPDLHSKTPASDLLKSTEVSLPLEEVLETALPGFSLDCDSRSHFMDKNDQHFPSSKDHSDGLPALPMNEFKSPMHEVILSSPFNEISPENQPQKYDLPLSVDKLIPNMSLSDALANEPFVINDSVSPVTDKIPEIPTSTADTKDPPLVENRLLSPEDGANPYSLVTDIPTEVLSSKNEAPQSTYLDKTSDEVLSESTLSELHRDDLPLPDDKSLPLSDNTLTNLLPSEKTLSTSKLPITKALLQNVLSDITKGVLSSQVAKTLHVKPPSDKTVYYVDEKSPLSKTEEIPLLPVENSFYNAEHNDNLINNLHVSKMTDDTPTKDVPFVFPLPMDKMNNDNSVISTDDADGENKNKTQTSDSLSDDQPLPKDKISPLNDILSDISRNEKPSSFKLPITKALLENVLSEINTKGLSRSVSKAVPATSSSVLDKTHYYLNSTLSDFAQDSSSVPEDKILSNTALIDNNLPFSRQSEDTLSLEDETLSEIQSTNIPSEISSSISKIEPNSYDGLASPTAEIVPLSKDKNKTKIPSSSKLPITKALLENVLSEINTKGFPLPVAKAVPVASRTQLDKTLYFLEPPRPVDTTEESSVFDVPTENDHDSEINEDVFPLSADEVIPGYPIIDIPTDELISGKMYEDNSDNMSEELEGSDETLFSEELTDEFLSEMEKQASFYDMPADLSVPPTKQLFSSRLPITKALLQKVLSDITEGAIAANDLSNHPIL